MTNTYGYNRKTVKEDEAILAAVRKHHEFLEKKGFLVVMTSLVGSQNYDLDTEESDIDTFSFVFPPLHHLANAEAPYNRCYILEDGHAEVKDIRIALNLLRKTSPNSVEYFASKYKVYNEKFAAILKDYLDDNAKLWHMVHCNYQQMLCAMAGMAHQLLKRNMPAGKRFAHAIRLDDMLYHFFNSHNASAVIELRMGGDRDLALAAKCDKDASETASAYYDNECAKIANKLDNYRNSFEETEKIKLIEQQGLALIDSFQWKLFKKYLMETNV